MKKISSLFALMFCAALVFAQLNNPSPMIDSIGFADKIIGKVILIGDTWAIESAENGHLQRYVPIGDDNSWKSEGQEIVFSGVIGKPDPNVRMIGNPLEVREWRKLYRAQPTDEH